MGPIITLLTGAIGGTAASLLARRRRHDWPASARLVDERAQELRRRLREARETAAEDDDFEAAGTGPEVVAPEEARPSGEEFEAMRRRVHSEARAAAEEMRRRADSE